MTMEEKSVGAVFKNRVEKYGDRVFLKVKGKGGYKDLSWNKVYRQVMGTARGLLKMGIAPGDRIAILSDNRPEWTFTDLACQMLGVVDAPIYATSTPDQCEYIIKDCGAKLVFAANGMQLAKLLAVRDKLDDVAKVIVFEDWATYPYPEWVMGFSDFVKQGLSHSSDDEVLKRTAKVGGDDLATLIYTSGTTGNPKGVMMTNGNFLANCRDIASYGFINDTDVALSFLPLSHSLERLAGYYNLINLGITIAYAESMDTLLVNMAEIKPTVMTAVPRFYEKVFSSIKAGVESSPPARQKIFGWSMNVGSKVSKLKMNKQPIPAMLGMQYKIADKLVFSKLQEKLGGKLRFFVSGGAPLAKEIAEFFHAAGILVLEGYGLTETAPVLTCNTPQDYRFGTVGKTIPSVTIRINEGDGEILAKGPNVMRGYYNLPEETKSAIDSDGWFHTGDVGEFDSDGFLKITDRLKDLIKTSGGKYVAPQFIEGLLVQNKFIEQVNVIGDKQKFCTALVVPSFPIVEKWAEEKGIKFKDRKELIENKEVVKLIEGAVAEVNKALASYESIKRIRLVPEEFTQENDMLTPSMKIKRKVVVKTYADLVESMYKGGDGGGD